MKNKQQLSYIFAAGISFVVFGSFLKILWVRSFDPDTPLTIDAFLSANNLIILLFALIFSVAVGLFVYKKIK